MIHQPGHYRILLLKLVLHMTLQLGHRRKYQLGQHMIYQLEHCTTFLLEHHMKYQLGHYRILLLKLEQRMIYLLGYRKSHQMERCRLASWHLSHRKVDYCHFQKSGLHHNLAN
jgi:hypothetical protein